MSKKLCLGTGSHNSLAPVNNLHMMLLPLNMFICCPRSICSSVHPSLPALYLSMFVSPNDAITTSFVTRSSQLFKCLDSIYSELSSETGGAGSCEYDDDQLEVVGVGC